MLQHQNIEIRITNPDTLSSKKVKTQEDSIIGIRTIPENIRYSNKLFSTVSPGKQWGSSSALPLPETYPVALPTLEVSKDLGQLMFYTLPISVSWIQAIPWKIQAIPKQTAALQNFTFIAPPLSLQRITDTLKHYTALYQWGDIGMYQLCAQMANIAYPKHVDQAVLLTAACMQHAGFRVEIAWQQLTPVLIVTTLQELYDIPALESPQQQVRHYLWAPTPFASSNSTSVYWNENLQSQKLKPLDLQDIRIPKFESPVTERSIVFHDPVNRSSDTFSVRLNIAVLHFMESLPQMEQKVYFSRALSEDVLQSLIPQLKSRIEGMRQHEALSWLLRFMQYSFPYVKDETQFGKEKVMFAEEALYYGYTDCEDRSVLFAALVEAVLKRPVVGIHFPGHVATAVLTAQKEARGARVKYLGHTYMICDPSYKHGMPGALPPELQHIKPRIIGN